MNKRVSGRSFQNHERLVCPAKPSSKKPLAQVYDCFKANVDGGEEIFGAQAAAVAEAEAEINAGRMADTK